MNSNIFDSFIVYPMPTAFAAHPGQLVAVIELEEAFQDACTDGVQGIGISEQHCHISKVDRTNNKSQE